MSSLSDASVHFLPLLLELPRAQKVGSVCKSTIPYEYTTPGKANTESLVVGLSCFPSQNAQEMQLRARFWRSKFVVEGLGFRVGLKGGGLWVGTGDTSKLVSRHGRERRSW